MIKTSCLKNFDILTISINNGEWYCYNSKKKKLKNLINNYVEENSHSLRNKYVNFISNFDEFKIQDKNIPEYFKNTSGYNLWWMSLIVEKSLYKSPQISDCIRLLALEEILIHNKTKSLIVSGEKKIIDALKLLADGIGIKISYNYSNNSHTLYKNFFSLKFLYQNLPIPVKGLVFFLRQIFSINLSKSPSKDWFNSTNSIMIFSYFIHLDLVKAKKGIFYSQQWEILPDYLKSNKIKVNWFHHFLKSDSSKNINQGSKLLSQFNNNSFENHSFINSFLSFFDMLKVFFEFIIFLIKSYNLTNISSAFNIKDSQVNLWPLLKDDFFLSIRGNVLVQNLIWIRQFDQVFKRMPKQKLGLYLMENQGWESAMLHAWKKYNHGEIIGIQHSVLRFWDLRYFDDFKKNNSYQKPAPDLTALNSPIALEMYLSAGFEKNKIIKLEALRYLAKENKINRNYKDYSHKILIVGDININSNRLLIQYLEKLKLNHINFSIKFHPSGIMDLNEFNNIFITEIKSSLDTFINDFNICISVGSTTAGLNAYLSGLKVIVFLEKSELNMSPLRGFSNVSFVNNFKDLKKAIINLDFSKKSNDGIQTYFWNNKSIKKWKSFLKKYFLL